MNCNANANFSVPNKPSLKLWNWAMIFQNLKWTQIDLISLKEAAELSTKLEHLDIFWFEEPVSPELYDHYAQLRLKSMFSREKNGNCV